MNGIKIFRCFIFSLEIFLTYIIQTTSGLTIEVFGGRPILLISAGLSIAFFEKEIPSIVFGTVCGLLIDFGYVGAVGYYGIMLSVMCWIVSILTGNYIKRNLLSLTIIGSICIPLAVFVQFVMFYLMMGYDDAWGYFLRHYLSRIIYTWASIFLFYYLNGFIEKSIGTKDRRSRFMGR